jgi:hypothetical protein
VASLTLDVAPAKDDDADGMPDRWEETYLSSGDPTGTAPHADPDGDGISNVDEYRRGTNPRARYFGYFAEASSGDRPPAFIQCFVVGALADQYGAAWLTLIGDEGRRVTASFGFGGGSGASCPLAQDSHPAVRVVAAILEADTPFATLTT